MAVYRSFVASAESYQTAATTLKVYLEEAEFFDEVTIDDNTYQINCSIGGTVVATVRFQFQTGGYMGRIIVSFGQYSDTSTILPSSGIALWIGKNNNAVIFAGMNSAKTALVLRYVFCKDQNGTVMMCVYSGSNNIIGAMTIDAEEAVIGNETTIVANTFYSNLCGICTLTTADGSVAVADKIFRYVDRQTNVPVDSFCVVTIGGVKFFTDGIFAVSDE